MTSEKKPFFSVVIPLYNKQSHVKETIKTVINQTFQNFEIVVVNDGSTDQSVKEVKSIQDNRIKLIHQENQGVSVARNRGIEEAKADYIAFLDADDIWLPDYLQTIYDLIQKYPDVKLYATAYTKMDSGGNIKLVNIHALPSKEYVGIVPNYFKSAVKGDPLVWTSATCIPRKVFLENDIWFPVGEKYGEDSYVWARIAMQHEIAYNTKECAVYQTETENNTIGAILKEKEPRQSFLMLKNYRSSIKDEKKLKYFDRYIEMHIAGIISLSMRKNSKIYGLKQIFRYKLTINYILKFLIMFVIPRFSYKFLKKIKLLIVNNK